MELSQRLDVSALQPKVANEVDRNVGRSAEARLGELISRITGAEVDLGKTLAELGVGSLDRIELAVRAEEEFGVQIDESLYTDALTVEGLAGAFAREE
ncbi:acyl carrier protein [Corynebacterium qintianiae]|uniref:acyl carrier protein n=1 Tax=Corynebacterium qintianiae TaxID=2709392 RepID=UPI0013EBA416|nr:acyl carrier protein [Corynebacterium qintianiae]